MNNPNLPAPDRLFEPDHHEEENNWMEKQDRRNKIKSVIAFILIGTAVAAFFDVLPHIITPGLFSDSDALLTIYALIAFVSGIILRVMANYCDNPHVNDRPWNWWMF